jgi:hypothetical protein
MIKSARTVNEFDEEGKADLMKKSKCEVAMSKDFQSEAVESRTDAKEVIVGFRFQMTERTSWVDRRI